MIMNVAYLVDSADEPRFGEEVNALERAYSSQGVRYELTGPWPPYNFADGEDGS